MNTNESHNKDYHQGTIVCSRCTYDENPLGATNCQKCGQPLVVNSKPKNDWRIKPNFGCLSLAVLSLLSGGIIYFLWQQTQYVMSGNSSNVSLNNSSSDIQPYDSMKDVPKVPTGTFNYGGSVIFASLTTNGMNQSINQAHPDFHLRYTEPKYNNPGNATGIKMLLDSELSFAQSSQPLEDEHYRKAKERGFSIQQVPVAIDGFLLFTHPDVGISGLSIEQIRDIYKGKITNWKEVGGSNVPITAFAFNPKFGAALNILLGSEIGSLSLKVQFMRDYTDGVRKVSTIPGAIGIGSTGAILGQSSVRPLAIARDQTSSYVQPFTDDGKHVNFVALRDGSYPLTRRLFVVIRRDGTPDEAAGVAYSNLLLSKEGQQIIEKAGFVPIQ
jgi:phosphate transport system substrate-binding protein